MIRVLDGRNFNFTLIENELIDDIEKFDKNDLLCYMVLCRYANNSTGECYPSYKTIAEKMRVGVSTAMKAIKSLESKGVIVGTGSACSSGSLETSHVLKAMGLPSEIAQGSIRFSFGTEITKDEVDYVVDCLVKNVKKLRQMSPLNKKSPRGGSK